MRRRILVPSLAALLAAALTIIGDEPAGADPSTTFGGVLVPGSGLPSGSGVAAHQATFNNSVDKITQALDVANWDSGNQEDVKQGTKADIIAAINKFKKGGAKELGSGDEFVFFFAGHGGNSILDDGVQDQDETAADPADEPDASDNHILVNTGARISDDDLATMLSGFKQSVTINVILSSCKSNTFTDGTADLPQITQKDDNDNDVTATGHVAVLAAGATTSFFGNDSGGMEFVKKLVDGLKKKPNGFLKADTNNDGTVTAKELSDFASSYFTGPDPACDEGDDCPIEGCGTESDLFDPSEDPLNRVAEPGLTVVTGGGGIAEPIVLGSDSAAETSASGARDYTAPVAAAAVAAGVLAIAAGGWYVRKRLS